MLEIPVKITESSRAGRILQARAPALQDIAYEESSSVDEGIFAESLPSLIFKTETFSL